MDLLKAAGHGGLAEAQVELGKAYMNTDLRRPPPLIKLSHSSRSSRRNQMRSRRWFMMASFIRPTPVSRYWCSCSRGRSLTSFENVQEAARSQYQLAMELLEGQNGVEQNLREGADMLKAAGYGGFAQAQVELGSAYKNAFFDFPQDHAKAVKWYRRATDQGDAAGQSLLAVCYFFGNGVDKNEVEAARLFRFSAEQGNAVGQTWLGYCYHIGIGDVNQDGEKAVRWYRLAIDQGDVAAQAHLGICYRDGTGVKQDYVEAARLFQLASNRGNNLAQKQLGLFYSQGHGVQRNCDRALSWLRRSGHTDRKTTKAIAEIEKSARDLLFARTAAQANMIEAGESVFGQSQDDTGDFALHVAAREMQADTVALLYDHPSFDELVLRANTVGELPRGLVGTNKPANVDTREAQSLRSVLSVSRRTRSACVVWCFEVLRDVAPERLLANIPRDVVQDIVRHTLPPAAPGNLRCGVATLLISRFAWPRPCLALAPPIVRHPNSPQDVLALQEQTAVVQVGQKRSTAAFAAPQQNAAGRSRSVEPSQKRARVSSAPASASVSRDQATAASARKQPDFDKAHNYLKRIKVRFAGQPQVFKAFLEILQKYHKEQHTIKAVYEQVAQLFHSHTDLLDEFQHFLPDPVAQGQQRQGAVAAVVMAAQEKALDESV